MCPGLCLEVVLRVPVGIKDDDSVRSGQVDPQTPGTGGKEEAEVSGTLGVEVVDGIFAGVPTNGPIQPLRRDRGGGAQRRGEGHMTITLESHDL